MLNDQLKKLNQKIFNNTLKISVQLAHRPIIPLMWLVVPCNDIMVQIRLMMDLNQINFGFKKIYGYKLLFF